jgi:hypothetical protein
MNRILMDDAGGRVTEVVVYLALVSSNPNDDSNSRHIHTLACDTPFAFLHSVNGNLLEMR